MQTKNDDFQAVKARIDIVSEITRRTGLTTKKVGESIDLEECPFCKGHECFRITPKNGLYKCHQCPSGGDIFTFVAEIGNCSKREALVDLAETCGYKLTHTPGNSNGGTPQETEQNPAQTSIKEIAVDHYHQRLLSSEPKIRHQTRTRGHSLDILKEKKIGLTDGKLNENLINRGFTKEERLASGLVKIRDGLEKDYFGAGLFIYPHSTIAGEIGHFTIKDPRKKRNYQIPNEFKEPDCFFYNMQAFKGDEIILVEGENDLLSIADRGEHPNVVAICGQISKDQMEYLVEWAPGKTILCAFDNDKAGKGYEKKMKEALKGLCLPPKLAKAIETPRATLRIIHFDEKYNDIDDWLKSKEGNEKAFTTLIENSETVLMPSKLIIGTYRTWCNEHREGKTNNNEMGEIVFDCLKIIGRFFVVGEECRLFLRNKTYRMGTNQAFRSMLYEEFGLNYAQSTTKQVVEVLQAKAYSRGMHTTVPGSIYGDLTNSTIYFNLNNSRNEIIELSPGRIQTLQNGTNNKGILLDASPKMKPLEYVPDADIGAAMLALKNDISENLTCSPSNRFFILCMLLNLFLIPFTKVMGIAKFSGNSGSAKTAAAAIVSILFFGEDAVTIGSTASDFSEATRSLITIADNLENSDISSDRRRFLLTTATGVTRQKRKGGTDSENVYEYPKSQVIVTAVEPFSENELIQRTNDIEFSKKYYNPNYIEAKALESKIIQNRDLIMSAIFKIIAHDVLPNFQETREKALKLLKEDYKDHSKTRLDELYSCLYMLCGELLKYIDHPDYRDPRMSNERKAWAILNDWITYQNSRSKAVADGANQILYRLDILLKEFEKKPSAFEDDYNIQAETTKNEIGTITEVKFLCTTGELFAAFEMLTKNRAVSRYYKSASQLGTRIQDSIEVLKENNWFFRYQGTIVRGARRHWFIKKFDMEN